MSIDLEPLQVALSVARALDQCGLRYVVGGSLASSVSGEPRSTPGRFRSEQLRPLALASSVSGEPRSTLDVDLVVAIDAADVEPLLAALGDDFHADGEAVRRAVRRRSSVNVFHRATSTKVDLFVLGGSPLDRQALDRRVRMQVSTGPRALSVRLYA